MRAGDLVLRRLTVDEDFRAERDGGSIVERTHAHEILVGGNQEIEQARTASTAEAALGPLGRPIAHEMLFASDLDVACGDRHRRSCGPASAHSAVADMKVILCIARPKAHCPAKATTRDGWHLLLLMKADRVDRLAATAASVRTLAIIAASRRHGYRLPCDLGLVADLFDDVSPVAGDRLALDVDPSKQC